MHQPGPGLQHASLTLNLDESRLSDSPMNWQRQITVLAPRPVRAFVPTIVFSASMLSPNSEIEDLFRCARRQRQCFLQGGHKA